MAKPNMTFVKLPQASHAGNTSEQFCLFSGTRFLSSLANDLWEDTYIFLTQISLCILIGLPGILIKQDPPFYPLIPYLSNLAIHLNLVVVVTRTGLFALTFALCGILQKLFSSHDKPGPSSQLRARVWRLFHLWSLQLYSNAWFTRPVISISNGHPWDD